MRLWNIAKPDKPVPEATLRGFTNYAYGVAFSPNGRLLAAGSADETIRLWNITDPSRPTLVGQPLTGPVNYVETVAFNPTSNLLAAAVADGTVWQWNVSNPAHPVAITALTAAGGETFVAVYNPAGTILAAAGNSKAVHLWDVNPETAATNICATVGDPITAPEWKQYLPGRRYDPPCR